MTTRTIIAEWVPGAEKITTRPLYQHDQGQVLRIIGQELPERYEVHFSNYEYRGRAEVVLGGSEGAAIPDGLLETGLPRLRLSCAA